LSYPFYFGKQMGGLSLIVVQLHVFSLAHDACNWKSDARGHFMVSCHFPEKSQSYT